MTSPEFLPSHVVPPEGMATWSAPDTTRPSAPLDPLLPVQIIDRRGDWALALCSNGWSTWVDGRLLLAVPREPPAAAQGAARTADPRPLLGAAEGELSRYRKLIEELAAGQLDGESFTRRTRGTRLGVVVDGDAVWLYDARHERWCYCDGVSLETYAVTAGPSSRSGERPGSTTGPEARDEPGPVADPPAPTAAAGPVPAPDPEASGPPEGPPQDPAATRAMRPGERPPPPPDPVGEIR
ncbi:hypothetical protein OG301_30480 [Streptomyces platensis]|uniref:hypothetical protein n=1 Tax=Streptomyces platensis TaxID=58346 RepID=UPI002E13CCC4|nr:hypothetical protein OG229_08280 [Streptomyces platensis]WTI55340.1 hypothetical protein OG301_30480 [Streptomyces platensis]WUB79078.1 hypothetical protein OG424_07785 [Streptomyces platensis]